MLPSKERTLKTNTDFRQLVLSCLGKCIEEELKRVKGLFVAAELQAALKIGNEANQIEAPEGGYYELPDYELRLYDWILSQLKRSDIINNEKPKEARSHFVEAVLAMFDELEGDDIKYLPEEQSDGQFIVDWDESKQIIKDKIIESEYLFGLAII